ncbi:MerR family transcriptional regulator [Acuticoccus sediminis]|uniref:MerR family transcriptional regulator n=1 Tax=Acuticoccus sediminis TaxID=2184697 RepID=UPI001CFC8C72|nr:MerR family transcriptional regulator [Acuticoccus sediminis]
MAGGSAAHNAHHGETSPSGDDGRGLIEAVRLADEVGVPPSVLTYLEARLPDVHSIVDGRRRYYRSADAALLAGCAELLYGEGRSFREVMGFLRNGRAKAVAKRGWALLRHVEAVAPPVASTAPPARAIPPDALVRHRGRPTAPKSPADPAITVDPSSILAELIECVRVLEAAR